VPAHLVDERQKLGLGVALARPFGLLTVALWTASGSARMSVEIAEATKSVAAGGVRARTAFFHSDSARTRMMTKGTLPCSIESSFAKSTDSACATSSSKGQSMRSEARLDGCVSTTAYASGIEMR
jgi:hypothetical protein